MRNEQRGSKRHFGIVDTVPHCHLHADPNARVSPLQTGEVNPGSDATFIAATMDLATAGDVSETGGVITSGTTSARLTTFGTPMFNASYSAQTGYSLSDVLTSAAFGPQQLVGDSTSPNGNGTVLFTSTSGAIENFLALYQTSTYTSSSKGAGYTTAHYGGVGGWQHTIVNGSTRQTRLDYFGYGPATPASAMPHSGVVKYTIQTAGNYATNTDLWFIEENEGNQITVDFGAGTVQGNVGLAGQNFFKSEVGGFGYFPANGVLNGNSVAGAFQYGSLNTSSSVPGQFRILFVGPQANELVLTYIMNDGSQAVVGAWGRNRGSLRAIATLRRAPSAVPARTGSYRLR